MKYLKKFANHTEYEAEKSFLEAPNVAWDVEHLHYADGKRICIAQLLFTNFQDYNLVDLYDFEDVNVSYQTASISIENDVPVYLIYENGAEFKFLVNVDGDPTYRFNNAKPGTIISEINDDLIEMLKEMGPSEKFINLVKQNKGKWIIDSKDAVEECGFIYEDKTYWRTGNEAGTEGVSIWEYKSDDESETIMWTTLDPHNPDAYEEGAEVSVDYYSENHTYTETITVTIVKHYALTSLVSPMEV